MRERPDLLRTEDAPVHAVLEAGGDEPEAVARVDLAPLLPAEHDRGVEQRDAHEGRIGAGVEEGADTGHEQLPRIVNAGDLIADRCHEISLELLVHSAEEILLVREVVVERAACDARARHDLLRPDPGVAAFGEQLARRSGQLGAGPRSLLRPRHTACMLRTYSLYVSDARRRSHGNRTGKLEVRGSGTGSDARAERGTDPRTRHRGGAADRFRPRGARQREPVAQGRAP